MLDILQLNDMLVPELRELAEQLGLEGYKKLNKQELIYKILDHQALNKDSVGKTENGSDTPESAEASAKNKSPKGGDDQVKDKKRRPRKKVSAEDNDKPKKDKKSFKDNPPSSNEPMTPIVENGEEIEANTEVPAAKDQRRERREPREQQRDRRDQRDSRENASAPANQTKKFNVELDGIIEGEGILEMMPDGYGFLRSADYNYLPCQFSILCKA